MASGVPGLKNDDGSLFIDIPSISDSEGSYSDDRTDSEVDGEVRRPLDVNSHDGRSNGQKKGAFVAADSDSEGEDAKLNRGSPVEVRGGQ